MNTKILLATILIAFTTGASYTQMRTRSQINLELARLNKITLQGRGPSNMVARCQSDTLRWVLGNPSTPSSNTTTWTKHIEISILGNPRN